MGRQDWACDGSVHVAPTGHRTDASIDTIHEVHGYQKQGAAYGDSKVKGLNAQIATLSSPTCAPVIAVARLRKGNAVSGHGADRLIVDAVKTARTAGVTGRVLVRPTPATTAKTSSPQRSGPRPGSRSRPG